MSALHARPGSEAEAWAEGLAWLWRLGAVEPVPGPNAIGVGTESEAAELSRLVQAGELRGAIVAVRAPGDAAGIPARRVSGVASFGPGARVAGEFVLLERGEPAAESSLGVHAAVDSGVLYLGYDPDRDWGRLDSFWAFEAAAAYLRERAVELTLLPPIGALRLDDIPGIALHQLQDRAKPDWRQALRIRRTSTRLRAAGAVLNVAVSAEALDDGARVPLDRVWPRSVEALHDGVERGAYEPVCHGLLHLDTDALERGEVEFREFGSLDAAEAGRRLDLALAWQELHLARPTTFCAPAWTYGEAGDEQAAARGLVRWYRASPGPVLSDGRLRETLIGELPGIHELDYAPLQRLAAVGVPPIVAMHGALLDSRMVHLSPRRNPVLLARLLLKRDVTRIMRLPGIRWLGAAEFVAALERHADGRAEAPG